MPKGLRNARLPVQSLMGLRRAQVYSKHDPAPVLYGVPAPYFATMSLTSPGPGLPLALLLLPSFRPVMGH
eukprot:12927821-Prorocentrum_lima.AAC.1